MQSQPTAFNRDDLARFIPDPRTIRAFENLDLNQTSVIEAVTQIEEAPIIGVTFSDIFSQDRALAGSSDILLADGGAKANLTIGLTTTGVSASDYGDESHFVRFEVDDKGRLTLAAQYLATTENVTEAVNLYFTEARARDSLSAGDGIDYNSATGEIAMTTPNASGSYTPTLTAVANVSATISGDCMWTQEGDLVTVYGRISVTPTVLTTSTSLGISLPVASNLAVPDDLAGTATAAGVPQSGGIEGDATNDRAQMRFISNSLISFSMFFSFRYRVLP